MKSNFTTYYKNLKLFNILLTLQQTIKHSNFKTYCNIFYMYFLNNLQHRTKHYTTFQYATKRYNCCKALQLYNNYNSNVARSKIL